jgi:pimeloyl-ACP methyl ester carboxylesterase
MERTVTPALPWQNFSYNCANSAGHKIPAPASPPGSPCRKTPRSPAAPWSLVFNLGQILRGGISFVWFTTDAPSGVSSARAQIIAAQAATARLRYAVNFPFPEINRVWGMADLGDAFRSSVQSALPTPFVAGTLDGITPVAQTRKIMRGFSDGRLLVVDNGGHDSQFGVPGAAAAIVGFYAGVTPAGTLSAPTPGLMPLIAQTK